MLIKETAFIKSGAMSKDKEGNARRLLTGHINNLGPTKQWEKIDENIPWYVGIKTAANDGSGTSFGNSGRCKIEDAVIYTLIKNM